MVPRVTLLSLPLFITTHNQYHTSRGKDNPTLDNGTAMSTRVRSPPISARHLFPLQAEKQARKNRPFVDISNVPKDAPTGNEVIDGWRLKHEIVCSNNVSCLLVLVYIDCCSTHRFTLFAVWHILLDASCLRLLATRPA
jgi:hypothetical protein